MSVLSSQVARAQRRLWLFRWCRSLGWSAAGVACGFALVVLVARGFGLAAPLEWIAAGLGAAGLIASIVWCGLTREDAPTGAALADRGSVFFLAVRPRTEDRCALAFLRGPRMSG